MNKTIVFIHGILLSGWVFTRFIRHFNKKGYRCLCFNYASRDHSIDSIANQLNDWVISNNLEQIEFVTHSMGGLVINRYLNLFQNAINKTNNVVCLGSPLNGSIVAKNLTNNKLGRRVLGSQTDSMLVHGVKNDWPKEVNLGLIIGQRNFGVGRLLGISSKTLGDGTVKHDEAYIQTPRSNLIVLNLNHTQLTFSNLAIQQVEYFLVNESFNFVNTKNADH